MLSTGLWVEFYCLTLASVYVRVITSMPIKDPTAGFVGYKREVLESIELDKIKFVGYAFQVEMKYKTWRKKIQLCRTSNNI